VNSGVYALQDQRLVRVDQLFVDPEKSTPVAKPTRRPLGEPAHFFRCLSFLLKSGYPLSRSMRLLGEGMPRPADAQVCLNLEKGLNEGLSMTQAFQAQGFPQELTSALEAGEASGRIEEAMEWYADFEEKNLALQRDIKQALFNPAITLGFSVLFALALPPLVLRDQLTMLAQSGTEMPLLSKMLLGFTELFFHPATLLVIPVMGIAIHLFRKTIATVSGRRRFERALQRVPILKDAIKRAAAARCLALMAMILRSGGSPMAAMLIASKGSGSRLLKDRMQISVHSLVGGIPFTKSLAKTNWFLRSSLHLMEAGEEVGDTAEMMVVAARMEEEKLHDALQMVAAVAQPAALLLIGALVGVMVIAVLGPSLSLISTV
jgi:type IV pilus assembly protein PilC